MTGTNHISLSQLQQQIKDTLANVFRGGVWVVAEIGELKVNASSGHCYMELVEKGGANGIPTARASATIWRGVYGMLSSYFAAATGETLKAGMKVLMKVTVTYHELYGLSLNITDIDPLYTLGDLERQKQETIAQLRKDGVFDLNRELEMPLAPQRLALVSSPNAAGYQDFMDELAAGGYYFSVTLFEAVMQGHGAEESMICALSAIADNSEAFDAVVIIRGGGSQSDLSFLNSYMLNFHIAQFPLPVIAGLGHHKDQSILDMVAALSLKTPTAVAGFLTQCAARVEADLDAFYDEIKAAANAVLTDERRRIQTASLALSRNSTALTRRLELRLHQLQSAVVRRQEYFLTRQMLKLDTLAAQLPERAAKTLSAASRRLDAAEKLVASRDPQGILALGFAIVRLDGRALRRAAGVSPGSHLDITLHEGTLTAKTE